MPESSPSRCCFASIPSKRAWALGAPALYAAIARSVQDARRPYERRCATPKPAPERTPAFNAALHVGTRVQPSASACAPPSTALGVLASKTTPNLGVIGPPARHDRAKYPRRGRDSNPRMTVLQLSSAAFREVRWKCGAGRFSETGGVESSATFGHVRSRRALHPALHPGESGYTQINWRRQDVCRRVNRVGRTTVSASTHLGQARRSRFALRIRK